MSQTVWTILGWLTILTSVLFFSRYPDRLATLPPEQHPNLITGGLFFAALLTTIACHCFLPQSRPITLRILGVIGVIGCLFNLVTGFQQRNFAQLALTLLFWLPGSIYLTLSGKTDA